MCVLSFNKRMAPDSAVSHKFPYWDKSSYFEEKHRTFSFLESILTCLFVSVVFPILGCFVTVLHVQKIKDIHILDFNIMVNAGAHLTQQQHIRNMEPQISALTVNIKNVLVMRKKLVLGKQMLILFTASHE